MTRETSLPTELILSRDVEINKFPIKIIDSSDKVPGIYYHGRTNDGNRDDRVLTVSHLRAPNVL